MRDDATDGVAGETHAAVEEPGEVWFAEGDLARVRGHIARYAAGVALPAARAEDAVLAVNELATNSIRHGGGKGTLRVWSENGAMVCEIQDTGHIEDPLAGRVPPAHDGQGGRGLWFVNQLCDEVHIRSSPAGTVVRIHIRVA